MNNIWLVEFPTYRYTQDVKLIARKGGLKVIDKKFAKDYPPEMLAEKTPTLTIKPEFKQKASE